MLTGANKRQSLRGWLAKTPAWCGALFLIAATTAIATAHELGDFGQRLAGGAIGEAAAAPPEGVYFENSFVYAPAAYGRGQNAGIYAKGYADVVGLGWSTGWKFLGADVLMSVSQGFFDAGIWTASTSTKYYPSVHDTAVTPLILSWNLGNGWFSATGFRVYTPDGTHSYNTLNPDYWTYEVDGAISYFRDGWNLTAALAYDVNTPSAGHTGAFAGTPFAALGSGYLSGDQMFLDLTATKKFGNFELGPVASLAWQTTADRPGAGFSCEAMAVATRFVAMCGRSSGYSLGGLIGYNFGRGAFDLYVTQNVFTRDDFGALKIWGKLEFPLWVAGAPKP